jgi:hypothetical protein
MSCGIYSLIFADTSVYIGQSSNLEKRIGRHLKTLEDGVHHNKNVQQRYIKLGPPRVEILELCDREQLLEKEIEYCSYIDSKYLLNIGEPGSATPCLLGELNGRSKYSNDDVVKVLMALANTDITKKELAETVSNISYSTIRQIAAGTTHTWLKDKYPVEYSRMLEKVKKKVAFVLQDKNGVQYSGCIQREFARTHNLCPTLLNQLIRGKRASLNGWILVSKGDKN